MRLMIVDDHPGVRELIRQWATTPEDVVCECGSGDEAVRVAPEFKPDAVAMDVRMPGICGFEAVRAILAGQPGARVVVVTTHDEPAFRRAASEAGAVGFFGKENLGGLRSALAGEPASAPAEHPAASRAAEPDLDDLRWWADNTREMLAEVTDDGELLQVSPNVRRLLGYEREELLGANVRARIHPGDLAAAGARPVRVEGWVTCRFQHKDGSWRWLEVRSQSQPAHGGGGRIRLIAREVTDREEAIQARQELQPELARARQLEALGTWAGGIAHDFNNVLAAIIAYGDLARLETSGQPGVQDYLDHLLAAGGRGKELTRQILQFTRPAPPEQKLARLQPVLEEALLRVRASLPENVELVAETRTDTGLVWADTAGIRQALVSLCADTIAALQGGPGRLVVALEPCVVAGESAGTIAGLRAGPHARLVVQENSQRGGAARDPIAALEPHLEEVSLGLAAARRVAREHHGAIQVSRRPGGGSRVEIFFPVAMNDASRTPQAPTRLDLQFVR